MEAGGYFREERFRRHHRNRDDLRTSGGRWGLLNAGAVGRISGRPPPRGGRGSSSGWSLPKRTGQGSCVGYCGALVRCCGGGQSFPNRTGKGTLNQRELDVPPKIRWDGVQYVALVGGHPVRQGH